MDSHVVNRDPSRTSNVHAENHGDGSGAAALSMPQDASVRAGSKQSGGKVCALSMPSRREEPRARSAGRAPEDDVSMLAATRMWGVFRPTILHRVKRSAPDGVHVRDERRKGLEMKAPDALARLFVEQLNRRGAV
jgi:hypothetical protein